MFRVAMPCPGAETATTRSWAFGVSTSVSLEIRLVAFRGLAPNVLLVFRFVVAVSFTATGAWSVLMMISCSSGVVDGSLVVKSARYCTYRARGRLAYSPGADTSAKSVQLASGVEV